MGVLFMFLVKIICFYLKIKKLIYTNLYTIGGRTIIKFWRRDKQDNIRGRNI